MPLTTPLTLYPVAVRLDTLVTALKLCTHATNHTHTGTRRTHLHFPVDLLFSITYVYSHYIYANNTSQEPIVHIETTSATLTYAHAQWTRSLLGGLAVGLALGLAGVGGQEAGHQPMHAAYKLASALIPSHSRCLPRRAHCGWRFSDLVRRRQANVVGRGLRKHQLDSLHLDLILTFEDLEREAHVAVLILARLVEGSLTVRSARGHVRTGREKQPHDVSLALVSRTIESRVALFIGSTRPSTVGEQQLADAAVSRRCSPHERCVAAR